MKESYRKNEDKLKKGYDCIMVARTRAADKKCSDIERDFIYAARKLSFLEQNKKS